MLLKVCSRACVRVLEQFKPQQCQFSTRVMKDPRFFTLYQHAKSRFLDDQRKSGVLSHKIEVNTVRLHFEMTGDGAHSVILLPGALGSSRTDFNYQLNHFNKRDFTLIAIDPRGYGQSIPPERDWPLEFLQRDAEDAIELVQKLGLEKFSILGWSDGGIVGMIMAARYPDLVKNLVVWGANAYITRKDMETFQGLRDISGWSEVMRVPFMALYGEKYFKEQWQNWVDAMQNYYDSRGGDICIGELSGIMARTLIIHGLKDRMIPLEHPDFLRSSIVGSKLYMMPEGKHNCHKKYYQEFNFLVEHFLRDGESSKEKKIKEPYVKTVAAGLGLGHHGQRLRDVTSWSEQMRVPFMALYGEKYFRQQWQNWVDAFQNYYDKRGGDLCVSELDKIKARTLVIHGMKDRMVTLEHPDFLHHNIKGSRLYIMPEGKHNLHMKYHREFNFLTEHFLNEETETTSAKHTKYI